MATSYARRVDRLTIDEAARRLGVSVSTIRRQIRAGWLRVEREQTPQGFRYVVLLEAAPDHHDHPSADDDAATADRHDQAQTQEAMARRIDWLERRVEELVTLLNREQEAVLRLTETHRPLLPPPAYAAPVHDYLPERPAPTQSDQTRVPPPRPRRRPRSLLERLIAALWGP